MTEIQEENEGLTSLKIMNQMLSKSNQELTEKIEALENTIVQN